MGGLVAELSTRQFPEATLLNGFCTLIRRDVLEELGVPSPLLGDFHFDIGPPRAVDHCLPELGEHSVGGGRLLMAQVAGELRPVGQDARLVRPGDDARRGALALRRVILPADLMGGDGQHGGADERVLALVHRPWPGVGGLALHFDDEAVRRVAVGDDADINALGVEERALLDVQLEV